MERYPKLGFGIMRMPQLNGEIDWIKSEELITEYMKGDFCYFDTHPAYMMSQSQRIIKEFVVKKYDRQRFLLANKMPYLGINEYSNYEKIFEQELAECGVEYFDYYLLHALSKDVFEMHKKIGGFRFLENIKKDGKAKKIGISFHDKAELLEEILGQYPEIDFVQLQINYVDWESTIIQSRKCYEIARKYNKTIIVMEPIKGGSLSKGKNAKDSARMALRFVKSLPGIEIILSGMSEIDHIRENRRTLAENNEERIDLSIYQEMQKEIKMQNSIPCTECRYCVSECPKSVKIPDIFSLINNYLRPGDYDKTIYGRMRMFYKNITREGGRAGVCIDCGMCEKRCPQKISIRKELKKAANMLEKEYYYTSERNAQILIYLMKEYGIKKIIASPGATNASFVYSVQQDSFFDVYSAPDERSAAYMACGMAEESGEIVALSCTGATASRNYIPGLTEAYYRNIPVLAITSTQPGSRIGHNIPQVIDRTKIQNDIAKMSIELPTIKDDEDEWVCTIYANKALNELWHRNKGPVHINLVTSYKYDFSVKQLPYTPVIRRIQVKDKFPNMPVGKIAIFCGAHREWDGDLMEMVDIFCEKYNAIVICDHTSNYNGNYRYTPFFYEKLIRKDYLEKIDLLIHMGNISGAYINIKPKEVWRVNPNGEYCDTFRSLSYVFEMSEGEFIKSYLDNICEERERNLPDRWSDLRKHEFKKNTELPFSNAWIASQTAHSLPDNAILHLGILNSLRIWNFYKIPKNVRSYANTGGFGIDGCLSALIGASLVNPTKLYFGVLGDLAFFYDMNSLGNRYVGNNIRLLIINNGCGTEFKNYNHAAKIFGQETDFYIAAKGHYGNKSKKLIKDYAEDLGFLYYSASSKEEYLKILPEFIDPKMGNKSVIVEIFTDSDAESEAYKILNEGKFETKKEIVTEKITLPEWVKYISEKEVILWGCGNYFKEKISKIEQQCKIRYVCDNDEEKWNKEVLPGIICISPNELKEKKNIFIVIVLEDAKIGFNVAHQLRMIGINDYDMVDNWLKYSGEVKWRDSV